MPKFDYGRTQKTAARLIEKFGRIVTLVRPTSETGATPWDPTTTGETTYETVAAILPASKGTIEAFDNRIDSETLIEERLRFLLMPGLGLPIEPKAHDIVRFDGWDWAVLGCTPLNPAGTAIMYQMGVKR